MEMMPPAVGDAGAVLRRNGDILVNGVINDVDDGEISRSGLRELCHIVRNVLGSEIGADILEGFFDQARL